MSNFLTTSLVWGILYLIVFLFPFFYYVHRFFFKKTNGEPINPVQVVFTGLILHLLIALTLIVFSYILNALNVQNFSPCKGIRFFLFGISPNTSCNNVIDVSNKIFWNEWYNIYKHSVSNFSNPISGAKKVISGTIYSLSLVLFFVLNALMLMLIAYPLIKILELKNYYNKVQENPSILGIAFKVLLGTVAFFLVIYLHFIIDTNFTTNICNVTGFDAYKLAQTALRTLFGISK